MANIGSGPGWILRTGADKVKQEIKQLATNLIEGKTVNLTLPKFMTVVVTE